MKDIELYKKLLGVKPPWVVSDVHLELVQRSVSIIVAYDKAVPVACPECGGQASIYDHQKRKWRHLDTMQFKTIIECEVPRARCEEHGVKQLPVPWAESNARFTALFEALVIGLLGETSISGTAELVGLSWDEVDGIQERAVKRGLKRRKKRPLEHIGIDETSFQKRHEYVTVILDRQRDVVLDVLDDRKAESLEQWFRRRPCGHLASVQTLTMDMWDPFILAVRGCIPEADKKICFDHYHVARHFGKALDKVRAQEHRGFVAAEGESPLTRTKYEWQKNSFRLDNRSRRHFMALSRMNLKTSRAWRIKETAAMLWNYSYRSAADKAWKNLLGWISRCRLEPVKKVGKMLRSYLWGVINAIIARVSNAMLEAKNSRIQWIKKMACGFRNRKRFRMAILFHLGGLNLMPKSLKNYAFAST
jgi:transposase